MLTAGISAARAFGGDEDVPPPIIEQFVVQPAVTDPGGEVTLKWKVSRAESVSISPAPGVVEGEGEATLTAGDAATTYILNAISGDHRRSSTISLQIAPQQPAIGYFEAEPAEIAPGQSVVLNWSVVGQGAAVTIEPGDGSMLAPIGSVILQPDASTVYTMTAANAAGSAVGTVQVTVGEQQLTAPPEIVEFAANPPRIDLTAPDANPNETVQLSWRIEGAESVEIVGDEVRSGLPAEGTIDVQRPAETTTYYLIANNTGGSATKEVAVEIVQPADQALPTPAMVIIPQPSDDAGVVEAPLDGSTSGNSSDGAVAQSSAQYTDPLPQVDLLAASPNPARVGDEVVVRWAVSQATTVSVETVPAPPGSTPLRSRAGVFRFIAKEDVAILLEASSSGGSMLRRQVGVRVLQAVQPVAAGVGGEALPLVAEGGSLGASAVVNDDGDVWLYRADENRWQLAGTLGIRPISVAIAGAAIFGVAEDGTMRALDLSSLSADPGASPAASPAASPRASPAGTPSALRLGTPVTLPPTCTEAIAVVGHERPTASEDQVVPTLLIACAEPSPIVVAAPTTGATLGSARWTTKLTAEPAGMSVSAVDGSTAAVHYPLFSPRATTIDLLDVASGQAAEVSFTGPVTAVTVSPDGGTVVAALFDDAALYVVDRRGVAPRRVPMPSPVRTLTWASSAAEREDAFDSQAGPGPTPFVGGTDAFGETNPVLPTPIPANPNAAEGAGSVLVTWYYRTGGSLVSLAPWSPTTLIAAEISPDRAISQAVDDGRAIVVASFGPNVGIAFPWVESGRGAP